jgi:hypothetical protein
MAWFLNNFIEEPGLNSIGLFLIKFNMSIKFLDNEKK